MVDTLYGPSPNQRVVLDKYLFTYFNVKANVIYDKTILFKIVLLIIDDYASHGLCNELQQLRTSHSFCLLSAQLNNKFDTVNSRGQKIFVQTFSSVKLVYLVIFELVEVLNRI